jgi:radical SAM superfamily enzyme YgiQ (UPF0313 family)
LRPDRTSIVYTNLIRQAWPSVPVVIGGVEPSLRRLAHYDYWSDKVRRSLLADSKADLLVYGMGEYPLLEIARQLKSGKEIRYLSNLRSTVYMSKSMPEEALALPAYEKVKQDQVAFAAATRLIHQELNPYCARPLAQQHGERWVVVNPPALPLSTARWMKFMGWNLPAELIRYTKSREGSRRWSRYSSPSLPIGVVSAVVRFVRWACIRVNSFKTAVKNRSSMRSRRSAVTLTLKAPFRM